MTLETYQTLFTIFLVASIILLILSIVFFFVFDISKIFSIKSGIAVKRSVKELNDINSSEDNRRRKKYKGHSVQLSRELTEDIEERTDDMNDSKVVKTIAPETITLSLDSETVPLKSFDEEGNAQPVENSSEENSSFYIFERKIVVFSQEIIAK